SRAPRMTLRMPSKEALPPYVRGLVEVLADPGRSVDLDLATWDGVVRVARSSQLLGTLAARMDAAGLMARCPAPVRNHLRAATMEARFLRHMALLEIELVA